MESDTEKTRKTTFNGELLTLSQDQYETAMCHMEHMRQLADENNIYEKLTEDDEEWVNSSGWKLSDTLEEAIAEGLHIIGENNSIQELIVTGLDAFDEESICDSFCYDHDADNVFDDN